MTPPARTAISFTVPGLPAPGGSKRAFVSRTGKVIVLDDAKRNKSWRSVVATCAAQAHTGPPLDGPLFLWVEFLLPRPKKHYRKDVLRIDAPSYHTKRPDATKLLRALEDACTGILWRDDGQVASQTVLKHFSDGQCGARVRVETMWDHDRGAA